MFDAGPCAVESLVYRRAATPSVNDTVRRPVDPFDSRDRQDRIPEAKFPTLRSHGDSMFVLTRVSSATLTNWDITSVKGRQKWLCPRFN